MTPSPASYPAVKALSIIEAELSDFITNYQHAFPELADQFHQSLVQIDLVRTSLNPSERKSL